jgi:YD repeat-containing protein
VRPHSNTNVLAWNDHALRLGGAGAPAHIGACDLSGCRIQPAIALSGRRRPPRGGPGIAKTGVGVALQPHSRLHLQYLGRAGNDHRSSRLHHSYQTATYDAAGRELTASTSSSVGTTLPTVKNEYNPETGAVASQSTTSEGKTLTISAAYNKLGQLELYTDADGNTADYDYDIDGRLETFNDGKGKVAIARAVGPRRRRTCS